MQQVVNHVSRYPVADGLLVGPMDLSGLNDLTRFTSLLKLSEKRFFLGPAHIAMLMMMAHAHDGFHAFLSIPAHHAVDARFMQTGDLSCFFTGHAVHNFQLEGQQSLIHVRRVTLLLFCNNLRFYLFAILNALSPHKFHLIS